MREYEIINCFINAASSDYFRQNGRIMLDEDLHLAFDEAYIFARNNMDASINQAHLAGHAYMAQFA